MSHNHHNKHYTQYSKMNNESVEQKEAVTNIFKPEENEMTPDACGLNGCGATENENAFNENPIEGQTVILEAEPTVAPKIMKIGKVYGCKRLNVRKQPSASAEIVCEIDEGSEVMIEESASNILFYKICTEQGVDGYCMKKFIVVVP